MDKILLHGAKGKKLLDDVDKSTSANFQMFLSETFNDFELSETKEIETVVNRIILRLRPKNYAETIWMRMPLFVTDEQLDLLYFYRKSSRHLCLLWTREDLLLLRDTFFRISRYEYWQKINHFHFVPSRWESNLMAAQDSEQKDELEARLFSKVHFPSDGYTYRHDFLGNDAF